MDGRVNILMTCISWSFPLGTENHWIQLKVRYFGSYVGLAPGRQAS